VSDPGGLPADSLTSRYILDVPFTELGRIFGRGGAHLRAARARSGADISVLDKNEPVSHFLIIGSTAAISKARKALLAFIPAGGHTDALDLESVTRSDASDYPSEGQKMTYKNSRMNVNKHSRKNVNSLARRSCRASAHEGAAMDS